MQFESHLTLSGVVTHALHLPGKPDLLLVIEDGANLHERSGAVTSSPSSAVSRNGPSRAHPSAGKSTALATEGGTGVASHAVARNAILLLCQGDWALSCSFVEAGDRVEISRFLLQQHDERRAEPPPLRFAGADGAFLPPAAPTSISNAPSLLAFASGATKTVLPRTTLCITPSSATEMIVDRRKRVVINFANVGNLTLLDMTDKELQRMEANHLKRLEPLQAPLHHQPPPSPAPVIQLIEASPRAQRLSQRDGGSPKSHSRGHLITTAPRSSAAAADAIPSIGVAGKNCYAAMDRYYDVVCGQSAEVHPNVAFIERVVGGNTGQLLDAGSGSGLYAFTLRALGARNITCLEKSLTMLRMLEEKNQFFTLVECDLPERQRKGPVRTIAGDVCTFRLPRVDPSTGEEGFEDFTTVLCLQVLSHLPDLASVQQALFSLSLHTAVGGQLLASIPNADVVVRKGHHQSHHRYAMERAANTMCAGATTAMPNGTLDVIQQVLIREPQNHVSADPSALHPSRRALELVDGIARRETTFHGTAFHPDAPSEEGLFVPFREQVSELLVTGSQFEQAASSVGFRMEGLYGSLSGAPFSATESVERVYVFRRREDQFGASQS